MKGGKSKGDTMKKTDSKLAAKRKATVGKERSSKKTASGKPTKDPNKPKRPPSAFFVFMEEFREQYKKEHPNNKSVAAVGKAGGVKWKSLSDSEKAPFISKAEKRKTEYEKKMTAYNTKQSEGSKHDEEEEEEESDKSKSEVNDDDEEESGEDEEDDD